MLPGLGYAGLQRPDVGQRGGVPGRLFLGSGPEKPRSWRLSAASARASNLADAADRMSLASCSG